jgi:hypothetical protein
MTFVSQEGVAMHMSWDLVDKSVECWTHVASDSLAIAFVCSQERRFYFGGSPLVF